MLNVSLVLCIQA